MSKDQLASLLARIKEDSVFAEKMKGASDLLASQAIAVEAGFDVTQEDWLEYTQGNPISDEDLEGIAGGREGNSCSQSSCK